MAGPGGEPRRLGVVGLRFGAAVLREHLPRTPGGDRFAVTAVCDRDPALAESVGQEFGVPAHPSLDAMLACERLDVLGLFTPPWGRAALVHQALDAGLDVVTTKPFEVDAKAAAAVLAEARAKGRTVVLNSPAPVAGAGLLQMRAWQEGHDLGRLVSAQAETWVSYREQPDGSWYDDPARCPLAPILRLGVYGLHDILSFAGSPESIVGMGSRLFTRRPTVDSACLGIRFRDGAMATLRAHFGTDDGVRYADDLCLQFERGSIRRRDRRTEGERAGRRLILTRPSDDPTGAPQVHRRELEPDAVHGAYPWEAIADLLDGSRPPTLDPAIVVRGVQIVEALHRLPAEGGHVVLPAEPPVLDRGEAP